MFFALPKSVQELAAKAYRLFRENPLHPSLRHHQLRNTKSGQHRDGSWSVSIGYQWRAIYIPDGDVNVWYWIGSHADYNSFTGN